MDSQGKSSRFSTLNVFGKFSSSRPPPPPPKDSWYLQSSASTVSFSSSYPASNIGASVASSSRDTLHISPQTPSYLASQSQYDLTRSVSPSPSMGTMTPAASVRSHAGALPGEPSAFRKGFSKLSTSLGKRPKLFMNRNASRSTLSPMETSISSISEDGVLVDVPDGDDGISTPFNVQHHLHVDEGLANLPAEWVQQLRAKGFSEADIALFSSRRNRTTYIQNHPDLSLDVLRSASEPIPPVPKIPTLSPTTTLLPNVLPTRSTSLRRPINDDAASISQTIRSATSGSSDSSPASLSILNHPYSYSTSQAGGPSPVPSPLPSPSFMPSPSPSPTTPSTATGFSSYQRPPRPNKPLPSAEDAETDTSSYDSPPPHEPDTPPPPPPQQRRQMTFHVMNETVDPPSPPPAYGPADLTWGKMHEVGDVKVDSNAETSTGRRSGDRLVSGRVRADSAESGSRSEDETVTIHERMFASPEPISDTTIDNEDQPLSLLAARNITSTTNPPRLTATTEGPIIAFDSGLSSLKPYESTGESSSPPASPIPRTTMLPPRLSLHQDIDSDLSSWSESLFSVMNGTNLSSNASSSVSASGESSVRDRNFLKLSLPGPSNGTPSTPKKPLVPPLLLASPSPSRSVISDADESMDATSPLFDEVMSLVQSPIIDASVLLVPTRPSSTYLANSPPPVPPLDLRQGQFNYDFLSHQYEAKKSNRNSDISQPSSRDSQATISASSRWSKATIVRDATRVTKPAIANAVAVPAPSRFAQQQQQQQQPQQQAVQQEQAGEQEVQLQQPNTSTSDISITSSEDASLSLTAFDFPMPPPSPAELVFGFNTALASPVVSTMPTIATSVPEKDDPHGTELHAPVNRLPSPSSTRSSQSSSSESSTSSSQVNPLSIASCSESSNDGIDEEDDTISRLANAVRVELRYTESETGYLSPADSENGSRKWHEEQARRISSSKTSLHSGDEPQVDVKPLQYSKEDDFTPGVVDWLIDSPTSPQYEQHGNARRDSDAIGNLAAFKSISRTSQVKRPSIQINGVPPSDYGEVAWKSLSPFSTSSANALPSPSSTSTSPLSRYRGWVSKLVEPLEQFIDHSVDPHDIFADMQEIAEGESGSVFVARVIRHTKTRASRIPAKESKSLVAIKNIPLVPGGTPKLVDLQRELSIMSGVKHDNILSMDELYVDLTEDSLWIKMELMERSLADMLVPELAEEGFVLDGKVIARFTSDMLSALIYLEEMNIAHRDVRSDNLLINSQGVLKIADFSHAIKYNPGSPFHSDIVGVLYWQAPEMRSGVYDVRKVDVWSVGATVWEMAEAEPPFINIEDPQQLPDTWPELSRSDAYAQSFRDFLSYCSSPSSSRPTAHDLLTTSFIRSACDRSLVVQVLKECKDIEERIHVDQNVDHRRQSVDSQGTVLS